MLAHVFYVFFLYIRDCSQGSAWQLENKQFLVSRYWNQEAKTEEWLTIYWNKINLQKVLIEVEVV